MRKNIIIAVLTTIVIALCCFVIYLLITTSRNQSTNIIAPSSPPYETTTNIQTSSAIPSTPEIISETATDLLGLTAYYSSDSPAISHLAFEPERLDYEGYRHTNCYIICCSPSDDGCYRRWNLSSQYSTLSGSITMLQGGDNSYWLEFYNGNDLIYKTDRLSSTNTTVKFSFNIAGVNDLTMRSYCSLGGLNGSWIIADYINIFD